MTLPAASRKPPLVSAIMPTYNGAPFLADAVDSVVGQTFADWELIVVNDGSTDDTVEVLRRYTDPRIHIVHQARNQGRAMARNVALTHARGRYIAICDSDDMSTPERFAKQVAFLEAHPDVDVVGSQMLFFWGDTPPRPGTLYPESADAIARRFARGRMAIANGTCMLRAECFARHGTYCPDLVAVEDFELFLRMYRSCRFQTLPEALLFYRHRPRGVPFGEWLKDAYWHRYALYRADRRAGDGLPFATFSRQLGVKARIATIDLLRYLNYRMRTALLPQRVLR
jgi:glycosyltransferase involved in cell wall biosynthesis